MKAVQSLRRAPAAVDSAHPECHLQLELYWGEARQQVCVFSKPPRASDLEPFGVVSVVPTSTGFELALADGKTLTVQHSDSARARVGPLSVIASMVPRSEPIARRPAAEWPWAFISLCATLTASLVAFDMMAPVRDEVPFVPKRIEALAVFIPPPKKGDPPALPAKVIHLPVPQPLPIITDGGPFGRGKHRVPRLPLDAIARALAEIGAQPLKHSGRHVAALAQTLPGAGQAPMFGSALGFDSGSVGIGAVGLRNAGHLGAQGYGHGRVQGVPHATRTAVHTSSSDYDRDAVAKVINDHLTEISRCYEQAMISGGSFSGKMQVEWAIGTSGRVADSRVKDTDITNSAFGSCVLARLNGWHFPPPRTRVVVSYPFHLSAIGY